jgi:Phosphotransferase enzyme family
MSAPLPLPIEVDDLTADWFSQVLDREVTEVTVLDRSTGTTGRARVELRGSPEVPASAFVKLPPFGKEQRELVDMTGMGVTEARFYRDLAWELSVRTPGVWFAETDGDHYVMVLEDLVATGCRFPSSDDVDIAARARDIVEQLAILHAPFWESARFDAHGDLAWVAARGVRVRGPVPFIQGAVEALGDQMDDTFHALAELYLSRTDEIMDLFGSGPCTLVHGDAHIGNLFVDVGDDRTGFLDWAVVCRAPGMRDVAYAMCNSVPTTVRVAIEREIVALYCHRLEAEAITLDPEVAWDQYRLFAVQSWASTTATAGVGSRWQPIEISLAGTRRATAACAHLDSVGLLEQLLG